MCFIHLAIAFLAGVTGTTGPARASEMLPLEAFFTTPRRSGESISPDGKWLAWLGPDKSGETGLWVAAVEEPAHPDLISKPGVGAVCAYFWLGGQRLAWQTSGRSGRPAFFSGTAVCGESRETSIDDTRTVTLAGVAPRNGNATLVLGISDQPTAFPDLYRFDLGSDDPPLPVLANSRLTFGWAFDSGGHPVAGLRWCDTGEKEIVDLRDGLGSVAFRAAAGDDLRLIAADPAGRHLWLCSNLGTDLTRLIRLDLGTGAAETHAVDPLARVDVEDVVLDPVSAQPLAACYADGVIRWQALDPSFRDVLDVVATHPAAGNLERASANADRSRWLLSLRREGAPAVSWIYDRPANRLRRRLWSEQPDLDAGTLARTSPVSYQAGDGTAIPAFLTTPRLGKPPWPLVVFPHGGPHMRTVPGFDGRVQFLASRGYAVLQPNYRGSRGFGKAYMNAADGQWGTGIMQTDLADGVADMIRRGIAAKGRVAILGGSYGGYAALAGLAFAPDVYDAGVCLFGISDLASYAGTSPAEWQPFAGDLVRRIGDPATPAGRANLIARSPAHHTTAIRAPLLLYHGLRDPLIPPAHAGAMLTAMRGAGKECLPLAAADEGHGFSRPETEMAVYRATEEFLHARIGGLLGPEPGPVVTSRLAELRATTADVWR